MESLDAISGAGAAAVSVAAFYPFELARVRLQLQTHTMGQVSTLSDLKDLIHRSIAGICDKSMIYRVAHTLITSFIYYRLYRMVVTRGAKQRTILGNIFASNAAAMITVLVAMPLEGLVLRQQVVQDEVAPSDSDINSTSATSSEGTLEDPCLSHRHRSCCTWWDRLAWLRDMYSGLTPALLLCANPAIHYTIYDYMKLKILNRRLNVRNHAAISMATSTDPPPPPLARGRLTYDDLDSHHLSSQQAFLVGIAAKAVATFVTFPLLRAKVLMMTGNGTLEMESLNENITASPDNGNICAAAAQRKDEDANEDRDREEDEEEQRHRDNLVCLPTLQPSPSSTVAAAVAASATRVIATTMTTTSSGDTVAVSVGNSRGSTEAVTYSTITTPMTVTERFIHWLRTSDVGRLVSILMSICRLQGVRGLYTGFFLHIFHTTLRGATSMSLKEFFLKVLSSSQVRTAAVRTR